MRERRPSRAATLALVAVGVLIGAWVVVTSAVFDIRRIEIHGNRRIPDAQVLSLAGAKVGTNLITQSMDELESGILRSPWFAEASAVRDLPSTLVLRVEERRPVAFVRDVRRVAVVAADGAVVEHPTAAPGGLVDLGRVPRIPRPGATLEGRVSALRVAASLGPRLRAAVASASEDDGEVALTLRAGGLVLYGPAEAMRAKNASLAAMIRYAEREGIAIESIDVRAPTAPALKPAGPPPDEDRARTTPG